MYTVRKKFMFEMAHRLMTSYTKECQNIHGHSYVLELFLSSIELNEDGMVIDFKEVKDKVKIYVDEFDHSLVLNSADKKWVDFVKEQNCKLKVVNYNPTAENIAKDFYDSFRHLFPRNISLKVRLHETTTGWAEYGE